MKVPKYIKDKMRSVLFHAQAQDKAMRVVEDWLEAQGISTEDMRDGGGCSLEELEYGNDIVDLLCERIENWKWALE